MVSDLVVKSLSVEAVAKEVKYLFRVYQMACQDDLKKYEKLLTLKECVTSSKDA